MALSKKDYEAFARILQNSEYRTYADENFVFDLAYRMADYFAIDNPRFDKQKWLKAAGAK